MPKEGFLAKCVRSMCPDYKDIPNKDPKFQAKRSLVSRCLKMLDDGEFDTLVIPEGVIVLWAIKGSHRYI